MYEPVSLSRDIDSPSGANAEKVFRPGILGSPEYRPTINSLAPFGNLFATSTGESKGLSHLGAASERRFGPGVPTSGDVMLGLQEGRAPDLASARTAMPEGENVLWAYSEQRMLRSEVISVFMPVASEEGFSQERQRFSLFRGNPSGHLVSSSRIEIAPGVDACARSAGALEDVSVIGELCLRYVPDAKRVLVMVTHDPEDGTMGLHFHIRTSAEIETIVAAEDRLHEAVFERIPVARRQLFSIGYELLR